MVKLVSYYKLASYEMGECSLQYYGRVDDPLKHAVLLGCVVYYFCA